MSGHNERIVIYNNNVNMSSSSDYAWWYSSVWVLSAYTILMIIFAMAQPHAFAAAVGMLFAFAGILFSFVWGIVKLFKRSNPRAKTADPLTTGDCHGRIAIYNNNSNIGGNFSYSWRYVRWWGFTGYMIPIIISAVIQPEVFLGLLFIWALAGILLALICGIVTLFRHIARAKEDARMIQARADEQNRLYLAGSERGIYGDYTPYTMPEVDNNMCQNDYDDGLYQWR